MRKRDVILSGIKSRIRKTTHKYGIEIPTIIDHGHRIDKENGKKFWIDANATAIQNIGVAFKVLPEGYIPSVGWPRVTRHLIWNVKMYFTHKARWVLDGQKNPTP